MNSRTTAVRTGPGLAVCTALLLIATAAGCKRQQIRITRPPEVDRQETAESIKKALIERRNLIRTIEARVVGRVAWQANIERFSASAAPEKRPAVSATAVAEISYGLFQATREPGEPRQTRLIATFPKRRAVLEMLAVDERFWLRKFQVSRLFVAGTVDITRPRPSGWTSMRPQDLGTLLLFDDLFPQEEGVPSAVYLETWPQVYILHILRVNRQPEPIYTRLWLQRSDLSVVCHQLFDADGTLVAEAQMKDHKDFPLERRRSWPLGSSALPPTSVRLPETVLIYWPRERIALQMKMKYRRINGTLDADEFAPPDPTRGAQVINIPAK